MVPFHMKKSKLHPSGRTSIVKNRTTPLCENPRCAKPNHKRSTTCTVLCLHSILADGNVGNMCFI